MELAVPCHVYLPCNYAFPLIHDNSDDLVRWIGYRDGQVVRPELELIGGRGKDLLVSGEGFIAPYVFGHLRRNGFFKLNRCQLEQIDSERMLVRVIVNQDYHRRQDEAELLRIIDEGLFHRFRLEVEYTDEVSFTKRSKFRPVISELATRICSN